MMWNFELEHYTLYIIATKQQEIQIRTQYKL